MPECNIGEFRAADGLRLVGEETGNPEAPAVILLHGGGQTRHSWASEAGRLAEEGYRIISYDARGHGESEWSPTADYSIAAMVRDLKAVIGVVLGPYALVGASMGGMTSFSFVGNSQPPLARALILVDIVPRPAAAGAQKIIDFMSAHQNGFATIEEAAAAVAAYNPSRPRPADPSGLWRNLRRRADHRLYWHWDPRILESIPNTEPPSFAEEALRVARFINIPTMLVRGGLSDVVDDAGVAELLELVSHAEVHNVAAAGHMVAGDDNGTFHEGIVGFLQRHLPVKPSA